MRVVPVLNIIPVNTVLNTTVNSVALGVPQMFGAAVQVEFTGTPTGTFKLQASSDTWTANPTPAQLPVNWTDVANSTFTVSSAGNVMWNVSDIQYNWLRVVYTDSSGGVSTAVVSASVANLKGF